MYPNFEIKHSHMEYGRNIKAIVVSNYENNNEIHNWYTDEKTERTKSDIGVWHVKHKIF